MFLAVYTASWFNIAFFNLKKTNALSTLYFNLTCCAITIIQFNSIVFFYAYPFCLFLYLNSDTDSLYCQLDGLLGSKHVEQLCIEDPIQKKHGGNTQ